jgi:hypothetical protein
MRGIVRDHFHLLTLVTEARFPFLILYHQLHQKPFAMTDPVRTLTSYFNLMDGKPKSYEDSVKAIVEDLYDTRVKMAGIEDEEIGFERMYAITLAEIAVCTGY